MENNVNYNSFSEPKLLWTNSAPTSGIGGTTISVDLSKYTGALILFRCNSSASKTFYQYYPKDNTTYPCAFVWNDEVGAHGTLKVADNGVTISTDTFHKESGDSYVHLYSGYYSYAPIPQKIYGCGFNLLQGT